MKKITENELLNKVSRLKEYIAVVESEQVNEVNWGALGTGAMNAVRGAGSAIANGAQKFFGSTAGKLATGAAVGAGGLAAGQALTAPGQAAAPAGTTKVPGKSDPAVKALQDKLIAAGAKIKADGIMGPATAAAQKQFPQAAAGTTPPAPPAAPAAGQPPAMTAADQEDADMGAAMQANAAAAANQAGHNAAVASGQPDDSAGLDKAMAAQQAPAAPAPAPAPAAPAPMKGGYGSGTQMAQLSQMAQQGLQTGQPASTDALTKQAQTALAAKTAAPAATGKPGEAAPAQAAAAAPVKESVNFRSDELSRIVSLVQYR
jgi:chemotaxis protein histidine kinase CheA